MTWLLNQSKLRWLHGFSRWKKHFKSYAESCCFGFQMLKASKEKAPRASSLLGRHGVRRELFHTVLPPLATGLNEIAGRLLPNGHDVTQDSVSKATRRTISTGTCGRSVAAPAVFCALVFALTGCGGSQTDAERAATPFNDPQAAVTIDGHDLLLTYPDGSLLRIAVAARCFDFEEPASVAASSVARAHEDLRVTLRLGRC